MAWEAECKAEAYLGEGKDTFTSGVGGPGTLSPVKDQSTGWYVATSEIQKLLT